MVSRACTIHSSGPRAYTSFMVGETWPRKCDTCCTFCGVMLAVERERAMLSGYNVYSRSA